MSAPAFANLRTADLDAAIATLRELLGLTRGRHLLVLRPNGDAALYGPGVRVPGSDHAHIVGTYNARVTAQDLQYDLGWRVRVLKGSVPAAAL